MEIQMKEFIIFELFLLMVFVGYLVKRYSSKDVPFYVKVQVYLSWLLSFILVAILPLDIFYTLRDNNEEIDKSKDQSYQWLLQTWKIVYWSTFILTWLILPVFQEYEDAGEFTVREKFKRAIYNNLIFYAVIVLIGGIFIGLVITITPQLKQVGLSQFLISIANCFGIFLIITLLGYGLVAIPRGWFRGGNIQERLKQNQHLALQIHNQIAVQKQSLFRKICYVKRIKEFYQNNNKQIYNQSQIIIQNCPVQYLNKAEEMLVQKKLQQQDQESNSREKDNSSDTETSIHEIKNSTMVALNRQVKRQLTDLLRTKTRWRSLLTQTFMYEDILENKHSIDFKIRSTFWQQRQGGLGEVLDIIIFFWYSRAKHSVKYIIAFCLSIFSIVIIIGEISIFSDIKFTFINQYINEDNSLTLCIILLIPLTYIAFSVYIGLFNLKFFGFYGLYSNQLTDSPSLLFASINFSRVSAPLCFNFLQMLKIKGTAFHEVMGDMDLVPIFGTSFPKFFPLILIVFCMSNVFNLHGKITSKLGYQINEFQDQISDKELDNGKKLLYKARVALERKLLSSSKTDLSEYPGYFDTANYTQQSPFEHMRLTQESDDSQRSLDSHFIILNVQKNENKL